ncbi:methyltransferase domain-containing protein [Pseudozobellia sp. WGM2]|uniref:methyltransferase domain-containing protein n=1 Tax=Pseudozobellia sp. WGM2 TaxID=2787625 RepID=UPI001ADEF48D|nr:methyltransferase domain-containing protein [Pseudozobellia sp. WGM2]
MLNFPIRNTDPELMDNPNVDELVLEKVFQDINKSNRLLGGIQSTIKALESVIDVYPKESYTILDMGSGDGETLRQVVLWARRKGLIIECFGVDLSEKGLEIAAELSSDFPEIQYLKCDILSLHDDVITCDVLLCSLTMHHFSNHQIPIFLERFTQLAHVAVIINDLERSVLAFYLFKAFSAIFIKTEIARNDGAISIKSGFTKAELHAFSKNITTMKHDIQWKWAFRYVWVMTPKTANQNL